MREMERLKQLEEELFSGNLDGLDLEGLRELLGDAACGSCKTLQQIMSLVEQRGLPDAAEEGQAKLSPKGVRKIGQLALRDIYQGLLRDRPGGHATDHRGRVEVRPERDEARTAYGDPLHLDLVGTLKKALARRAGHAARARARRLRGLRRPTHTTTTSTVLLLDMSWSMCWEGRFAAAKKVALALESLRPLEAIRATTSASSASSRAPSS